MYHVYILRCADDSFYIGQSQNVDEGLKAHQSSNGPTFMAAHLPVELVYQEQHATLEAAVQRERQLNGWARANGQSYERQVQFAETRFCNIAT